MPTPRRPRRYHKHQRATVVPVSIVLRCVIVFDLVVKLNKCQVSQSSSSKRTIRHTVTNTKERTRATIQVSPPSKRTIKHKKAGKREPHSVESKEKHTPSTRKVLLTMEQKDRRNKARRGTRGTEIANRRKKTKKIQMFVNANGERQRRIDPQPAQRVCSQWSRNLLITQRRTRMKR